MLTLLDFKKTGIEDLLLDLHDLAKYASAHDILTKINDYSQEDLYGETGSVSVLVAMLAEYLRNDVQSASAGALIYLENLKMLLRAQPLSDLTLFELVLYQEMIENIERVTVSSAS